jgi:hypothetical protein
MRARPGLFLLAGALALGGCGHSSGSAGDATTDDVKAAYDASVAGLDRQYFDDMSMSSPTAMRQVLLVPDSRAGQFVAEWEGALAAGATAARLSHPARLTYVEVFEHASGDAVPPDEALGYSIDGPTLSTSQDSESTIEARAAAVLQDFDLTPVTVRVLHPYGPALFVEARTDDESSVSARMGDLERALDPDGSGLEGMYVEVSGPDGPLFRGESAHRIAEGGQWFAEGFDSGIPHG